MCICTYVWEANEKKAFLHSHHKLNHWLYKSSFRWDRLTRCCGRITPHSPDLDVIEILWDDLKQAVDAFLLFCFFVWKKDQTCLHLQTLNPKLSEVSWVIFANEAQLSVDAIPLLGLLNLCTVWLCYNCWHFVVVIVVIFFWHILSVNIINGHCWNDTVSIMTDQPTINQNPKTEQRFPFIYDCVFTLNNETLWSSGSLHQDVFSNWTL